ncbi:hypothetical protein PtA15_4A72 [Puccinia triticina]|uniref:Tet-like 2OG-Fe(II) oxygenase domain-containing protein n=1 Tax=Puccinia triticina TaxID=208348 RepID=A0ABY7CEJ2_9BASI|nr:uncharacterized protein PtA15_4A72 [Puccinia triticina]WAQ83624.1 hypothetical protein PtA15_4A72 [Puccinia triticina]
MFSSVFEYMKQRKRDNRNKRRKTERHSTYESAGHAADPLLPPEKLTWSIKRFKKTELFPHRLIEGDRKPTDAELAQALKIAEGFHYFGHGKVVVIDEDNPDQIIAIIEFTKVEDLTLSELNELNIIARFIHKFKQFVNAVNEASRSWGGYMWMVGWRKGFEAYQLAGVYLNSKKIEAAKDDYNSLMRSSSTPSNILGKLFKGVANIAFEKNRELMKMNSIPAFGSLHYKDPLNKFECSPNLSFTTGGYFNPPHKDTKDAQDFAFALFLPTNKSDGSIIASTDVYHVKGGSFVFPNYRIGINLDEQKGIVKLVWASRTVRHCTLPARESPTQARTAMSLQINQTTLTTFRDINNGSIYNRPAIKKKAKENLFVAGHDYAINPSNYPHP